MQILDNFRKGIFKKVMTYITLALQLLPLLLKSILVVEDTLNTAPGATKKAIVLTALDQNVGPDNTTIQPIASKLIDSIVGVLNKTIWADKVVTVK